jgi:NADPH:quinone reductase-like Zn-dependent oxidoreductase
VRVKVEACGGPAFSILAFQDTPVARAGGGDFRNCEILKIPGISHDGRYQQYMVAPVEALAPVPDSLSAVEAPPLLCAGITTYNALRPSSFPEVERFKAGLPEHRPIPRTRYASPN